MKKPEDFNSPTAIPESEDQSQKWQELNYKWWQSAPMRYDWKASVPHEEFSKEFYEEIDRRFFESAKGFLPENEKIPFDSIINFGSLKDKRVLEIGVGNGSHAQLLAQYSKSFTGIDLTDYAVKSTQKRFEIFGLSGDIKKMDAEQMNFPDNSFDFIWSWGVIHHSANTENILRETKRVLRPGGWVIIMVYYRGWWNYYIKEFIWGVLSGNLLKTKSLHKSAQIHSDGAMARHYTVKKWRNSVSKYLGVKKSFIGGSKSDIMPLPGGKAKDFLIKIMPNCIIRFGNTKLKMGSFLISQLEK